MPRYLHAQYTDFFWESLARSKPFLCKQSKFKDIIIIQDFFRIGRCDVVSSGLMNEPFSLITMIIIKSSSQVWQVCIAWHVKDEVSNNRYFLPSACKLLKFEMKSWKRTLAYIQTTASLDKLSHKIVKIIYPNLLSICTVILKSWSKELDIEIKGHCFFFWKILAPSGLQN